MRRAFEDFSQPKSRVELGRIYPTEHILAVIGAAVVCSMIIHSAAAFEVRGREWTRWLPLPLKAAGQ